MTHKDIKGYEGKYAVDELGNVYSYHSKRNLKPQKQWAGYRLVSLGNNRSVAVHRLVAKTWLEQPSDKHTVNHKNGIKHDNRVSNLEWVTLSENIQHGHNTGLYKKFIGEDNFHSKVTNQESEEIKLMYRQGFRQWEIAQNYGIDQSTVSLIVNNKRRIAK